MTLPPAPTPKRIRVDTALAIPSDVPVLTEVLQVPDTADLAMTGEPRAGELNPALEQEIALETLILQRLQRHLDAVIETRLREGLAEVVALSTTHIVQQAREDMSAALRDAVSLALAEGLPKAGGMDAKT